MHPAHGAFRQWLRGRKTAQIGQVWIRVGARFELRHEADRDEPDRRLRTYRDPLAARAIAMFTGAGKYRPLHSAPNLRRDWRIVGLDFAGLVTALDGFYPAAIVHWHAWRSGNSEVTTYRLCAARQSGMYRITTKLSDEQVPRVAACCCNDRECLKVPLWGVDRKTKLGLEKPARADMALMIPCPEPCSLFLSFARKAVRLEQEETRAVQFAKSDLELIGAVLRGAVEGTLEDYREGDYNDPRHRQRIQYCLRKWERLFPEFKPTAQGVGE